MPYDLFISYSRQDNAESRVTQLIERIKTDFAAFAGRPLNVFFDRTEIQGMDDWRHSILQGLRESRLLLACFSPGYLNSGYCEWEFVEYLKHEVARGFIGEGVAPVYFVAVPGWEDQAFDERVTDWIRDLRRRQTIDLRRWYHEGEAALRNAEIHERMSELGRQIRNRIQQGEVVERSLGNVDRHNPHFVGRLDDLRRLRETVGSAGMLAVHGLGGMGKTALAVEYAHAFAGRYGGGRWQVACEGRDDLRVALASLAPSLGVEFNDEEKLDLDLQFARLFTELRKLTETNEPHQCLLILDNVDQPALLNPAQTRRLPAGSWLHIIVTTRLGDDQLQGHDAEMKFLPVDELSEPEAIALIESYQPGGHFQNDVEREATTEIVRLLERLTLAVEAVAVFLRQFPDVTCQALLARLRREGLGGLEIAAGQTAAGLLHGEKRLTVTLRPTLERLTGPEKLALRFASLLPADHIALPWIRTLVAADFPEVGIDADPGYPDAWLNLLRRLLSLRLLQPTQVQDAGGRLLVAHMNRLLHEVVKAGSGEPGIALEKIVEQAQIRCLFLKEEWLDWANRWEIEPLRALSEELLAQEHNKASWIANSVGERLFSLARYQEAEPLMRRALRIDEQNYGREHPNVAIRLNNLAQLLQVTNRLPEAETLMRRALVIDEQTYGPEHPEVATDLTNLAQLLKVTSRVLEAEPLMRRALAIDEQSYGPAHPDVARDLNNLAQLLQDTSRLREAEPLMRRVVEILEQSYALDHPRVVTALNNLALLLQATDRPAEAEELMRHVVEIFEESYGVDHPNVATVLNNLAGLLQTSNRSAEAEELINRALAINEQSYGPEHPEVATALNNLALLLQATKRPGEAEPLMRRVVQIFEQSYGMDHPNVATALNNLALLLQATSRPGDAEPLMRRVLKIILQFTVSTGHEHPNLRTVIKNYAGLLQQMGRSDREIHEQLNAVGHPFGMQFGVRDFPA